jgi:hypothetical protein
MMRHRRQDVETDLDDLDQNEAIALTWTPERCRELAERDPDAFDVSTYQGAENLPPGEIAAINDVVRSLGQEWRALARARLGFPPEE